MLDINYRDIPKKPIHRAAQLLLIFGIRILRGVRRFLATGYLKIVVRHCGVGCRICGGVQVFGPQNIVLGDGVVINEGVILQSCDNAAINIGNHVRLSYGSYLITGGLDVSGDYQSSRHVSGPIHIEDYAWIGARAVILPGVTIGKGAIVAAGAVVTRDVEEFTIMAGIPAKRIGNRAIH